MIDGLFKKENTTIRKPDIEDMIRLKREMTYKEIGEIYGLSKQAVYRRIKRFKEAIAV
jgi:DNA-directed RNA polymerase specialized sigma subunit